MKCDVCQQTIVMCLERHIQTLEVYSSKSEADTASGQDAVASVESEDMLILKQCDNQTCFSQSQGLNHINIVTSICIS